jgi:hypothetical protein
MRSGIIPLLALLGALIAAPDACAGPWGNDGAWGDQLAPAPIRTIAVGIGMLAMVVLGSLLLFILGERDELTRRR